MPKYSTPLEALETCLRIWKLLAAGEATFKEDAYVKLNLVSGDKHHCPACQYGFERVPNAMCTCCPLYPQATEIETGCCRTGEPYDLWKDAGVDSDEALAAAASMVALVEARIEATKKEQE